MRIPKMQPDTEKKVLGAEDITGDVLSLGLETGHIVVPENNRRKIKIPCAIGKGLKTKVNANIGLSPEASNMSLEMEKMRVSVEAGADTIMDLSTGAMLGKMRKEILSQCAVPVGTVPVYELVSGGRSRFISLKEDDFISVLQKQAEEGVDFFTIHAGITLEAVRYASGNPRVMNIVSRGGALLASWMMANNRENPFFSRYDDVLRISREFNVVLSLGDSLRPGSVLDATDRLQVQELLVLGDLQKRTLEDGVQVMIEGPGHVPLDQIEANVKLQKSICNGAPFYVLGPLVTDSAPGYDHIVGAIGGAIAAWHGADFLCYVTPAEHLRLPDVDDVRKGVMASRIAAHAADMVKGIPSAIERDRKISMARSKRDWKEQFKYSLDPKIARETRKSSLPKEDDVCTMCSDYCSIKITEETLACRDGANEGGEK